MIMFIVRRLIMSIPVLIGILVITFTLGRLIPGDPCQAMLGEKANPTVCAAFIDRFGLNKSLPEQFAIYAGNFLHGQTQADNTLKRALFLKGKSVSKESQ